MSKKLTFTRRSLEGIADNKDAERELKRMDKELEGVRIVPESVWLQGNAMLAERAAALAFSTRLSYSECQKEVLRRHPFLRLGVCPYMRDRDFSAIEFLAEDESNDDAT